MTSQCGVESLFENFDSASSASSCYNPSSNFFHLNFCMITDIFLELSVCTVNGFSIGPCVICPYSCNTLPATLLRSNGQDIIQNLACNLQIIQINYSYTGSGYNSNTYNTSLQIIGVTYTLSCPIGGTTTITFPTAWTSDPGQATIDATSALINTARNNATSDKNKLDLLQLGSAQLQSIDIDNSGVSVQNLTTIRNILVTVLSTVDHSNGNT